jgi:hypothetical protein
LAEAQSGESLQVLDFAIIAPFWAPLNAPPRVMIYSSLEQSSKNLVPGMVVQKANSAYIAVAIHGASEIDSTSRRP